MNYSKLAALALTLLSATAPARAEPPERERHVIVYGNDTCPAPETEDEIVVCGRQPEEERYRIPRELRRNPDDRRETGWGAAALDLDDAQRWTRPNGCSPVGSNGQTGCSQDMIRQWYAERRAARAGR